MTLTQEQKQALREKTASAKTQSKLTPHAEKVQEALGRELDEEEVQAYKQLAEDVSRETSDNVAKFNPQAAAYMDDMGKRLEQAIEERKVSRETSELETENSELEQKIETVDDIPWNGSQPFHDDELGGTIRSLVPMNQQAIVEGFTIPPGMDEDQVLDLSSAIYTYIGPIPVHIGRYTNKWFKVLGCCVQPLEGDVINEQTGEVEHIKWERPLFKLDKVDPDAGENIIAYGGGIRGLQIARHFNAISGQFGWTVGDFKRPRMFYVQQENRENAHVMYGFRHRACTDEEMSK